MANAPGAGATMTPHVGSPRVLVAQLGARRHYLVPRALSQHGALERFYTDVYFGRRPRLDPLLAVCLGSRAAAFRGRRDAAIPTSRVVDFPYQSLVAIARRGSPCRRWLATGRKFAASVAQKGFGSANTVIAYSSAALELFELARPQGILTVLDHATAPRDLEMAAVAEEEERFPGWAAEPVMADPGLGAYADRQHMERGLADRILCGSTFVAAALAREGRAVASALRVLPLGVAASPIGAQCRTQRPRGELRVLFVGNEGLRKGLGYLLEAVGSLKSDRVRLRIAGNPGFSALGMSEVRRLCEDCRVVPRHKMPTWYAWADVLVLPSISDTFGITILEAMSSGLPVIASTSSGGPDVIRGGVDGWTVPPRDAASIADKLDHLAAHTGVAHEMGAAARTRAAEFNVNAYQRRLLEAIAL